jgi:uncharacterized protein YciI
MSLFVKFGALKPDVKLEDLTPVDAKFAEWLKNIAATGKYIASGGFETRAKGMTILEADSREEAMQLFEEDPFNPLLSSWYVHQWILFNGK